MAHPEIDQKTCIRCQTCVKVCPVQVYEFDSKKNVIVIKHPDRCIGCKICEIQCPVKAIIVKN